MSKSITIMKAACSEQPKAHLYPSPAALCISRCHARHFESLMAYVFEAPARYDLILGRNFLRKANMKIDFEKNEKPWFENCVPFHDAKFLDDGDNIRRALQVYPFLIQQATSCTGDSFYNVTGRLKAADYKKVDIMMSSTSSFTKLLLNGKIHAKCC